MSSQHPSSVLSASSVPHTKSLISPLFSQPAETSSSPHTSPSKLDLKAASCPPLDVETTNWNAVKILASQHGISLDALDEVRTAIVSSDHLDESEDFGVGTPLQITAARISNGRVVYRFRSRQGLALAASSHDTAFQLARNDPTVSQEGMPRSSSSGAIYNHPGTGSFAENPSQGANKAGLGGSLFRMTGNRSLKQSKSIPVLRRKVSGSFTTPTGAVPSLPPVATDSYPIVGMPMGGAITLPARQPASSSPFSSGANLSQQSRLGSAAPLDDSSRSTPMMRAGSNPVKGAHANRRLVGHLEEGDVLGAVLGLRHEEFWFKGRGKGKPKSDASAQPANSTNESETPIRLSPRHEAAATLSLPKEEGQENASYDSSVYHLPPFGADLLMHRHTSDSQPDRRGKRLSSSASSCDASADQTEASSSPNVNQRDHLLPELDLGTGFAKSPRIHQLREAQSFESQASDSTARGRDAVEDDAEQYPAELRAHLRAAANGELACSETLIFDVLQAYHRPHPTWSAPSPTTTTAASSRPRRAENGSQHRRFNSADLISNLTSSRSEAEEDAQKLLIAQAQALPTSAAPGDDARFALYAIKSRSDDGCFVISNRRGETDLDLSPSQSFSSFPGSPPGSNGTHHNTKMGFDASKVDPIPDPASRHSVNAGKVKSSSSSPRETKDAPLPGKPILLAASAARIVAELTAEIDQTLLIDFFYTFREFLDPLDLLKLLTLRFEWAVSEASSPEDEARRRIVRVRTYVVIKYWLSHHFDYDFLPNRNLRQRLATWLNKMARDERMARRPADLSIINNLRKVVRGLKETYSHSGVGGLLINDAGRISDVRPQQKQNSLSTNGSISYDSEMKAGRSETPSTDRKEEMMLSASSSAATITEDVNLDFSSDQTIQHAQDRCRQASSGGLESSPRGPTVDLDAARAAQKASAESVILSTPPRQPVSSVIRSSRASHMLPGGGHHATQASAPAPLPNPSSALSRAFVQTVGRLSRFKRVLGSRGLGVDASHDYDVENNDCSDLLFAKGGLESFLQFFELDQTRQQSSRQAPGGKTRRPTTLVEEEEEEPASHASEDSTGLDETPSLVAASTARSTPASSIDLSGHSHVHTHDSSAKTEGLGIDTTPEDIDVDSALGESAQPRQHPLGLEISSLAPFDRSRKTLKGSEHLHHTTSEQTLRSVSRNPEEGSQRETGVQDTQSISSRLSGRVAIKGNRISCRGSIMSNGAPRIVQLDDIDLSSDEDDYAVRRALRRLPGARDLRQANTIKDLEPTAPTRSSMDSLASSMYQHSFGPAAGTGPFGFSRRSRFGSFGGHARSVSVGSSMLPQDQDRPPIIGIVQSEMLDPDEALQGYELVKGFDLDGVESDEDEPGDVEAALRRLEGIIDQDRQKQKAHKVERLWQRSIARNAKIESRDEHDLDDDANPHKHSSISSRLSQAGRTPSSTHTGGSFADNEDEADVPISVGASESDAKERIQRREIEVCAPAEPSASFLDMESNGSEAGEHQATARETMSPAPSAEEQPASSPRPSSNLKKGASAWTPPTDWKRFETRASPQSVAASALSLKVGPVPLPPIHRSFLLSYRSESIARQMCLIEAELLRAVSWDELSYSRWKERRYGSEVTDWEVFYRDRVRDRLESQRLGQAYQERNVEAIVSRFNLTSNWVASEVVLTQNLDERAAVISKFIRVAWKCYLQSNFASLAQIIFGLSTPWVERLRRSWNRVGYYEMRIWRDLNSFVGPRNNFRHLRNAMLQLVDGVSGVEEESNSTNLAPENSGGAKKVVRGCIPFFGLFLSDLMVSDSLPTFLDPSSPTRPARFSTRDTDSKNKNKSRNGDDDSDRILELSDPHAFDGLPPLPPSLRLEPLINVLKFRNTAQVIKQIIAFQNSAKNYSILFEAEKGAYVRCLKIRCLPGELLARISHLIEP